jgi:hypothetical protein
MPFSFDGYDDETPLTFEKPPATGTQDTGTATPPPLTTGGIEVTQGDGGTGSTAGGFENPPADEEQTGYEAGHEHDTEPPAEKMYYTGYVDGELVLTYDYGIVDNARNDTKHKALLKATANKDTTVHWEVWLGPVGTPKSTKSASGDEMISSEGTVKVLDDTGPVIVPGGGSSELPAEAISMALVALAVVAVGAVIYYGMEANK